MHAVKTALLCVLLSVLVGCSAVGRVDEIIPAVDEVSVVNRHSADVLLKASGGHDSTISNGTFESALMQTLNKTGIFSAARIYGRARYELLVVILTMEMSGFNSTVDISSHWVLRDKDGTEVWSEKIDGTGTSYAFAGVARLRASHEQAAKDTIVNGVERLSQLSL